jgi:hypothetical protein
MSLEDMQEEFEEFHLANAMDVAILMHRDVHFGGNFDLMLEYYVKGEKGINPLFEIERIQFLAASEVEMKKNLAAALLTASDAETVAKAKKAYKQLRELYEIHNPQKKYPLLIADLILTESEDPQEEIAAIVNEKGAIVPALLELIQSEDFYDTLFPGYGLAPSLAMKCLGLIGDKRAIIALFEAIGTKDFFDDSIAIEALHSIGDPAKKFLLTVLQGKPLNTDNERAAMALIAFKNDPEIAEICLKMLQETTVLKQILLATYLILNCETLSLDSQKEKFRQLETDPRFPKMLRQDFQAVIKAWR